MILTEIVSQHVEEAAFLWLLRSNDTRQPHYALKDLAKLDDRVEAHLDGLRVAEEPGWRGEKRTFYFIVEESGCSRRAPAHATHRTGLGRVGTALTSLIEGMRAEECFTNWTTQCLLPAASGSDRACVDAVAGGVRQGRRRIRHGCLVAGQEGRLL